ncbi:unnamed protein product [Bathycoccus prasinos]
MAPRHKKDTDLVTIYILKCKEKKWYVGKTSKYGATKRIVQHFANIGGSNWTRRYKPIKVDDVKKNQTSRDEDKWTKVYMDRYGVENVRGGAYCKLELNEDQIRALEIESAGSNDLCYYCKKKGHFMAQCKEKYEEEEEEEEYEYFCEMCEECGEEFDEEEKFKRHQRTCNPAVNFNPLVSTMNYEPPEFRLHIIGQRLCEQCGITDISNKPDSHTRCYKCYSGENDYMLEGGGRRTMHNHSRHNSARTAGAATEAVEAAGQGADFIFTMSGLPTPTSTLKWNFSDKHDGTAEGFSVHDDQTPPCYVEKASDGTWSLTLTGVLANRQDQSPGNNWDYIETTGGTVYLKYKNWDSGGYWSGPYTRAQWSSSIGSETIRIYEHSSYSEQYNNGIFLIQESSSSTPPTPEATIYPTSGAWNNQHYFVYRGDIVENGTAYYHYSLDFQPGNTIGGYSILYDYTNKIWKDGDDASPFYLHSSVPLVGTSFTITNPAHLHGFDTNSTEYFGFPNPYYEAPAYRTGTSQAFSLNVGSGSWANEGYTLFVDDNPTTASSGVVVNGVRQWEWDLKNSSNNFWSGADHYFYFIPGNSATSGLWYLGGSLASRSGSVITDINGGGSFNETNAFVSGLVPYGDIP